MSRGLDSKGLVREDGSVASELVPAQDPTPGPLTIRRRRRPAAESRDRADGGNRSPEQDSILREELRQIARSDRLDVLARVDVANGTVLDSIGAGQLSVRDASAGTSKEYCALLRLGSDEEGGVDIEEVVITRSGQYLLLRVQSDHRSVFVYVLLDQAQAYVGAVRSAEGMAHRLDPE